MEVKKSIEADAEGMRSSLFMVGLNYIAGLTLAAFTFQSINTDDDLAKLDDKSANNVYQQEVKKATKGVGRDQAQHHKLM